MYNYISTFCKYNVMCMYIFSQCHWSCIHRHSNVSKVLITYFMITIQNIFLTLTIIIPKYFCNLYSYQSLLFILHLTIIIVYYYLFYCIYIIISCATVGVMFKLLLNYSGTSDNGHSEKRTTFVERTNSPRLTSEIGTTSL